MSLHLRPLCAIALALLAPACTPSDSTDTSEEHLERGNAPCVAQFDEHLVPLRKAFPKGTGHSVKREQLEKVIQALGIEEGGLTSFVYVSYERWSHVREAAEAFKALLRPDEARLGKHMDALLYEAKYRNQANRDPRFIAATFRCLSPGGQANVLWDESLKLERKPFQAPAELQERFVRDAKDEVDSEWPDTVLELPYGLVDKKIRIDAVEEVALVGTPLALRVAYSVEAVTDAECPLNDDGVRPTLPSCPRHSIVGDLHYTSDRKRIMTMEEGATFVD